jgi:hypothetical protein
MMKETIFKNMTFSLILTNIWSICAFFIYFFETPGWFHGFEVLGLYLKSSWLSAGIGLILVLLRLFYFKKGKKNKLVFNFIYSCVGTFNLFLSIIFIILACFDIVKAGIIEIFLPSSIIAAFIFIDIYKTIKENSTNNLHVKTTY